MKHFVGYENHERMEEEVARGRNRGVRHLLRAPFFVPHQPTAFMVLPPDFARADRCPEERKIGK